MLSCSHKKITIFKGTLLGSVEKRMIEQRRAHYLSLLDIDQYVPRRLLSAAPVPVLLEPIEETASPPQTELQHSENTAEQVRSSEASGVTSHEANKEVNKVVSEIAVLERFEEEDKPVQQRDEERNSERDEEKDKKIHADTENTIEPVTGDVKPLAFVLSVWRIHDQLLVIDTRQPATAYPTDRLLQNMLRAMGYSLAQLPPSETLRWPIFTHQRIKPLSEKEEIEQASAMVQAFISAQLSKQAVKGIVCMGETAARFCSNTPLDTTFIDGENELKLAVTPSLHEMLQEPMLKADAWKALQTLCASANNVS